VLGELRCASQDGGRLVELHRIGHQLALHAVGVGHLRDVAVRAQLRVVADLEAVLHRRPLTFERPEVLDPLSVRPLRDLLLHERRPGLCVGHDQLGGGRGFSSGRGAARVADAA